MRSVRRVRPLLSAPTGAAAGPEIGMPSSRNRRSASFVTTTTGSTSDSVGRNGRKHRIRVSRCTQMFSAQMSGCSASVLAVELPQRGWKGSVLVTIAGARSAAMSASRTRGMSAVLKIWSNLRRGRSCQTCGACDAPFCSVVAFLYRATRVQHGLPTGLRCKRAVGGGRTRSSQSRERRAANSSPCALGCAPAARRRSPRACRRGRR